MVTKEGEKLITDKRFIIRVFNIIKMCDDGIITDKQGIEKLMRSSVSYKNKRFALEVENE